MSVLRIIDRRRSPVISYIDAQGRRKFHPEPSPTGLFGVVTTASHPEQSLALEVRNVKTELLGARVVMRALLFAFALEAVTRAAISVEHLRSGWSGRSCWSFRANGFGSTCRSALDLRRPGRPGGAPDRVLLMDELPHTAIGELNERQLREQYGRVLLEEAWPAE